MAIVSQMYTGPSVKAQSRFWNIVPCHLSHTPCNAISLMRSLSFPPHSSPKQLLQFCFLLHPSPWRRNDSFRNWSGLWQEAGVVHDGIGLDSARNKTDASPLPMLLLGSKEMQDFWRPLAAQPHSSPSPSVNSPQVPTSLPCSPCQATGSLQLALMPLLSSSLQQARACE